MSADRVASQVRHVRVPADHRGQRLDNFLVGLLDGVPRSLVYRLVRTGQVRVNGGRAKPMKKLQAGDDVRIPPVAVKPSGPSTVPAGLIDEIRSRMLERTPNFCVVDKPAGLAMHGGSGLSFGLMDVIAKISPDWRPVHRLDRATSGLVVLACHHQALVALQRCFARREVEKRYLALLSGQPAESAFTVDRPLKKIRDSSGQHRVIADDEGQPACSHFRVLERLADFAYVEVRIETGRTHQIRAHAAAIGHPLAGDARYNAGAAPAGLKRLFLHSHFLRLPWPEDRIFNSPLPEELGTVLQSLRRPGAED
ncbi:MAG: RluA family pseudouridine synthase [Wenzhouxiangella sp.]|jgi:23S rRNA pseudouridine955/2504/2580 synthase|nr:RluA family pseudouridine synthase [Wenzhouxiangella sp.]